MANQSIKYNADHLEADLKWLQSILEIRLKAFVKHDKQPASIAPAPEFAKPVSIYQQFVQSFELNSDERLILLLPLLPYISPYLIENLLIKYEIESRQIAQLGGVKGSSHGGIIPTGETALFLLAGRDLKRRIECGLYFSPKHKFYTKGILKLEEVEAVEPEFSGVISVSKEVLNMITSATSYTPLFNTNFPAKQVTTEYEYKDLVLEPETRDQLDEIKTWLDHRDVLLKDWGFDKKINAGYKCLFYGPPGTGKSLAAALLGKHHNLPVYRIDLSMVISKYIGETEKNLSRIFDAAGSKNWILFFDEADALFGKRSNIQSANDRFANQEVSYLLMRMEEYNGLAILATNLKMNIDKAFLRRFQNIINFPAPDNSQRLKLWEKSFSSKTTLHKDVDLKAFAENFALTGAGIMNVVRTASITSLKNGKNVITRDFIMDGIRKELQKESSLSGDGN